MIHGRVCMGILSKLIIRKCSKNFASFVAERTFDVKIFGSFVTERSFDAKMISSFFH